MAVIQSQPKWLHTIAPFAIGGFAGSVSTTVVQPLDMIKVRLQLIGQGAKGTAGTNPLSVARQIISEGSFFSLYNGLSAAYLRQFSYSTLRIGFFDLFLSTLQTRAEKQTRKVTFGERAGAGLAAGGLAAWFANPVEVALVRMQSDGMKPIAERKHYRSVFHTLGDVARNEGVKGLWRGSSPTVVRAMATNLGQLAFFAEAKARLKNTTLSSQTQTFVASAIGGFFAAFLSLPFDFLKTRLQKADSGAAGSVRYKGLVDCAVSVVRTEGLLRFYRGFPIYFLRIAPHSFITMIVADNLKTLVSGKSY